MEIDIKKLTEPFPPEQWDWRVQRARGGEKPWAMVIPYIDARAIQKRLDDVVGPDKWQVHYRHENGGVMCVLALKFTDWVAKEDGSDPTDSEPFKGAISKSLVRAASAWGIGRHLYEQNPQFAQIVSKDMPNARHAKVDNQEFYWLPPNSPGSPTTPPQSLPDDPGEYIILFGKYQGRQMKHVPLEELEGYAQYLRDNSRKNGKNLSPQVQEFMSVLDKFRQDEIPF